jgi:hypothetical protein
MSIAAGFWKREQGYCERDPMALYYHTRPAKAARRPYILSEALSDIGICMNVEDWMA